MGKFQFWLPTKLKGVQEQAVDSREPIFLTGVPGTGKTVVSIFRLKNSRNSILFTYGKLLRKTIEDKVNDKSKVVENIHNWNWNTTNKYLERNLENENLENTIKLFKSKDIHYNQILVDEGQDLLPNSYKLFKEITDSLSVSADEAQQVMNKDEASGEDDILSILPNLNKFELHRIYRSTYEMYDFARQFVPYNERANDDTLLERLENEN